MSKKFLFVFTVLVIAATVLSACGTPATATSAVQPTTPPAEPTAAPAEPTAAPAEPTVAPVEPTAAPAALSGKIVLWTKEGETDGGLQYVQSLADAFTKANPGVTFEVVNKEVETLREDFQTSSLAGNPPDLLWTVADHVGPFTAADLIQPTDKLFDLSQYVDSAVKAVQWNGQTWGVPISNGNHLMLLYNKSLVPTPPKNTDELISMGKALTKGTVYGLAYNQTEPFWLVPWLGGFGGSVFAADGVTPTLDTPEMVAALQFLYDLKYTDKITPAESDYNGMDALFKEGKAAMIINGDWSLSGYKAAAPAGLGDNLGVAPIPMVSSTGKWPAPYTAGTFFMIPKSLEGDKLNAVVEFVKFATNNDNQVGQVKTLSRLPALKSALQDPIITSDPILKASAEAMTYGTPQPTVLEMRCAWDSMKPEMQAVLAKSKTPADAAKAMQASVVPCIAKQQ